MFKITPKLLVVIPAYNEEEKIGDVLKNIPRKIKGIKRVEVLVINDGSVDKTNQIAKKSGANVINHPRNLGLGAAFDTGQAYAIDKNFDFMVIIDGDGQFNPKDILKIIRPILDNEAECVTASRFIDKKFYPKMSKVKFFGNKIMAKLISNLSGGKIYDATCGFRAYSREALLLLNFQGQFNCSQETLLNLSFKKARILEIPIEVKYYSNRSSRVASNLFRYALNTTKIILKTYRDYRPFVFFGQIALTFFIVGGFFFLILLITFLKEGTFSPNKWSGFVSGALFFVGIIFFAIALLADMNTRIRLNQEKILYYLKKRKK